MGFFHLVRARGEEGMKLANPDANSVTKLDSGLWNYLC